MRRAYRAPVPSLRCTATVTLKDKTTADCMRPRRLGALCWQHAKKKDWCLAWVRLERAIERKLDKLESTKDSDDTDFREVTHQVEVLEEVQEIMLKCKPRLRKD